MRLIFPGFCPGAYAWPPLKTTRFGLSLMREFAACHLGLAEAEDTATATRKLPNVARWALHVKQIYPRLWKSSSAPSRRMP